MVGVGAIAGLALGARLANRARRPLPWLFAATICAQVTYSAGMLAGTSGLAGAAVAGGATFVGAAAIFAMSPIVQGRLAEGAGPLMTVAFALNGSMIFLGQGLGTAAGGLVAAEAGLPWIGVAGAAVAGLGLILARRVADAADDALPTRSQETTS
jgi:DHA1 family inner membrane transport protein